MKLTGTAGYSPSGVSVDVKTAFKNVDLGTILSKKNLRSKITSDLAHKRANSHRRGRASENERVRQGKYRAVQHLQLKFKKGEHRRDRMTKRNLP